MFRDAKAQTDVLADLDEDGAQIDSMLAWYTAVQQNCISLPKFAICENADPPQSAPARVGCSVVCTTSDFAQKKNTNPVGGRGISAFQALFFFTGSF
ncbi:hypothetical protein [Pseudomonas kitaguniensis]|uniref:hypothetical protein n=1 Tax=Pseudomonas kitaguniensis TaxID=2607908 RepID=UPI003CFC4A86